MKRRDFVLATAAATPLSGFASRVKRKWNLDAKLFPGSTGIADLEWLMTLMSFGQIITPLKEIPENIGWRTFRWTRRENLFGRRCLIVTEAWVVDRPDTTRMQMAARFESGIGTERPNSANSPMPRAGKWYSWDDLTETTPARVKGIQDQMSQIESLLRKVSGRDFPERSRGRREPFTVELDVSDGFSFRNQFVGWEGGEDLDRLLVEAEILLKFYDV